MVSIPKIHADPRNCPVAISPRAEMESSVYFQAEDQAKDSLAVRANLDTTQHLAVHGTHHDVTEPFTTEATDNQNPMQDDRILLQGLRIADPYDNAINTIRKVPSDQKISMLRWG